MTAATAEREGRTPTLDVSQTPRTPFTRLVGVEFRKSYDTRAGFWLILITGLLVALFLAATLVVVALNDDMNVSASGLSQILTIPLTLLLPVLAIQIVTAEWGQRTGLVTFALEPHRLRVVWAKLAAATLLALAAMVLALVLGVVGTLAAGAISGDGATWNFGIVELSTTVLNTVLFFVMAFGFGALLLSSPAAISIYYVVALLLPFMVYSTLYAIFSWAQDVIPWIDLGYAIAPIINGDGTGMDWVRTIVTTLVWVIAPLVFGITRILRAEVK